MNSRMVEDMDRITLEYYNRNTKEFIENTRNVEMSETIQIFLQHLPPNAHILDFGCGSGRDVKYFLEKGYQVDAIDAVGELCKEASLFTGIEVKRMDFMDLDVVEKYDGIWACASILHLSSKDLVAVLEKIATALKPRGVLYTSFKYGTFEGLRNGRYFIDMTEQKITDVLKEVGLFSVEGEWVSTDIRPGREVEKWLNLILRKKI